MPGGLPWLPSPAFDAQAYFQITIDLVTKITGNGRAVQLAVATFAARLLGRTCVIGGQTGIAMFLMIGCDEPVECASLATNAGTDCARCIGAKAGIGHSLSCDLHYRDA